MSDDPRDPERLAESAAADMTDLSGMPTADEAVSAAAAATGPQTATARPFRGRTEYPLDQTLEESLEQAKERLRRLEGQAQTYIRRNPLRSAGLAFAAGYLIAVARRL
jgi:ElaB/YqjD/DUF883 family membrane-anchored ribosome-binding protein